MSYSDGTQAVRDVADLIFNRLENLGHSVESLKLQKLLYYSKAWSLALRGSELFPDDIQAWKHGPVVASLYAYHRGAIVMENSIPGGNEKRLSHRDRDFVNHVIDAYGDMSGWALRNRTHQEDPWISAWRDSKQGSIKGVIIDVDSMRSFYSDASVPASLEVYK
ncbi:Panacea domain-containing protein [Leucobacter chromiireducens]|uniref:Panacea domain-containing protein n=1 Tax=Leucobacter chromiireducens TaxID=283877 RepID=UPI003F7F0416